MIVQCDAKGLEIYCGAFLSQDKTLMQTLIDGIDIHGENQRMLGLPDGDSGRLVAKVFIFRLMYGGSAYSYAHDPDFMWVSTSEKFWQRKIDAFYNKYPGFARWHETIIQQAMSDGHLVMPTGRVYNYELTKGWNGELKAPQTKIKNYPVQGLGADIMAVARVSFFKRFKQSNIRGLLVNTVHDSIVGDVHKESVIEFKDLCHAVFRDLPTNFQRVFKVEFNLPLLCEVQAGVNMFNMEEV